MSCHAADDEATLGEARLKGVTVVYSVAGKYERSDIAEEVAPGANDPWVKSKSDKFLNTDLEKILKDKSIRTVIVTGNSANGAVLYTGTGAVLRGLKVIAPVDGISANELYEEQITVWHLANGPGFGGQVTITQSSSKDVFRRSTARNEAERCTYHSQIFASVLT